MLIGIEIEAENDDWGDEDSVEQADEVEDLLNEAGLGNVGVCYDGSLGSGGVECKPLRGLYPHEVTPWVNTTCRTLRSNGYETSARCGLHVHFDRESIPVQVLREWVTGLSAWTTMAAWSGKTEFFRTTLHRLGCTEQSGYACAASPVLVNKMAKECVMRTKTQTAFSANLLERLANHYLGVSWSQHYPTIEIRLAAGTLSERHINAYIRRLRTSLLMAKKCLWGTAIARIATVYDETPPTYDELIAAIVSLGDLVQNTITDYERGPHYVHTTLDLTPLRGPATQRYTPIQQGATA